MGAAHGETEYSGDLSKKIDRHIDNMPPLPATVTRLVQIANDKSSSPSDLKEIISMDPVLTSKILKLVNSAYISFPTPVSSLVKAVIILGVNTIKNMALSMAVIGKLHTAGRIGCFDLDQFWRHSLGCAVTSRNLAAKLGVSKMQREDYFVAGLIHDIGKLVLCDCAAQDLPKLKSYLATKKLFFHQAEEKLWGLDHANIGGILAVKWNMAGPMTTAIKFHHHPELVEGDRKLVGCVYIANCICRNQEISASADGLTVPIPYGYAKELGLKPKDLDQVSESLSEDIEKAKEFIKVAR